MLGCTWSGLRSHPLAAGVAVVGAMVGLGVVANRRDRVEARPRARTGRPFDLANLAALLVDVDGTLIDSNAAHADTWAQALTEYGIPRGPAQIRAADRLGPRQAASAGRRARGRFGRRRGDRRAEAGLVRRAVADAAADTRQPGAAGDAAAGAHGSGRRHLGRRSGDGRAARAGGGGRPGSRTDLGRRRIALQARPGDRPRCAAIAPAPAPKRR